MKPVIERFIHAMETRDYKALAACFSEDGQYIDYSPSVIRMPNHHVYGRAAVEMFFTNRFTFGLQAISTPVIAGDNQATYNNIHYGQVLPVQALIGRLDEAGLISQLIIQPAT